MKICKTKLSDCGLGQEAVDRAVNNLEAHGMIKLGESGTVTPAVVRKVLEISL